MIKARQLIIDDIIFEHVEILPHDEIENHGFRKIFEEYSIMFCHHGRWHASHEKAVSLIHLRHNTQGVHRGEKFERIVISSDKSYDDGRIILPQDYDVYNIPILWKDGYKTQLVFIYQDGIYITSDFNVQHIKFPPTSPYMRRWGRKLSRGVKPVRNN
jgi:hypothetical protein